MTWQNPWAWIGLLALALPVLVHLLARRTARVQPFPTLRFLATSPVLATRRTRLTDPILLIVRCAILFVAVAALAQPYLHTDRRADNGARTLTSVIVVDTSASMQRGTAGGEFALAQARRGAAATAAEAGASTVIESAAPAAVLTGATAWLATRTGRHELMVLSDFQHGTLDSLDLAALPAHIGIRLTRIATTTDTSTAEHVVRHAGSETVARVTYAQERSDIEWSQRVAAPDANALSVSGADSAAIAAASSAARAYGARTVHAAMPITVSLRRPAPGDSTLRAAAPLSAPWMSDVVTRLARDPLLAHITPLESAALTDRLLLLPRADETDHASTIAALLVAAGRAANGAPPASELEPRTWSDAELSRWQREAGAAPGRAGQTSGGSDGRWLWLAALALLAFENWLRRRAPRSAS